MKTDPYAGTHVNPLLRDFRFRFDTYDPWGGAVAEMFAICFTLYAVNAGIPEEWEFRPGLAGREDIVALAEGDEYPDNWVAEGFIAGHWNVPDLIFAGRVLFRYIQRCEAAGLSY